MPSVFTLESPFGDPFPSPDYVDLLGDPGLGYDAALGHSDIALDGADLSGVTEYLEKRGVIFGAAVALGMSLVFGAVVGHTAVYAIDKFKRVPR